MEWETDRNLQARMAAVFVLLAVLPIAFTVTMTTAFNYIVFPIAEGLLETELGQVSLDLRLVFVLTLVGLGLAYLKGGDVALQSTDARVVDRSEAPELHSRVQRLAATVGMPAPDVAVIDSDAPNAFATGRSRADGTVAVTTSLRETLDDEELDAVLAHELAHVRNRDATVMSIAYLLPTVTYVVAMLTYRVLTTVGQGFLRASVGGRSRNDGRAIAVAIVLFVVTAVVTITVSAIFWAASFLLFRLISQYREYAADRGAAAITGDPTALASALETIDGEMQSLPDRDLRDLDGGVEALYIAPLELPVFDEEDDWPLHSQDLFPHSHPPTTERVAELRELAGSME